jgi:hypothetical protein
LRSRSPRGAITLLLAASVSGAGDLSAQFPARDHAAVQRKAVIGNVLISGAIAGVRARIAKKSTVRAVAWGLAGGTVIGGGKLVGSGPGAPAMVSSTLLTTVGTAMVGNAGAGRNPLSEVPVSFAMLRLRLRPFADDKLDVTVNAFDTGIIAHTLLRDGLAVDWRRSAQVGTFVFMTRRREIILDGDIADGVAVGPIAVVSEYAFDKELVWRHEAIHLQQYRFASYALALPVEEYLRERFRPARKIPRWLDLGIIAPLYMAGELAVAGRDGPTYKLREQDAEAFERR